MQVMDKIVTGYEGRGFKGRHENDAILVNQFHDKLLKFGIRGLGRGLFCPLIGQGKQEYIGSNGMCFHEEAGDTFLGQGHFPPRVK